VECYENGKILKYDSNKPFDEYGQLGDHVLDLEDFQQFEISKDSFENIWNK
jgi:hypothetical protein